MSKLNWLKGRSLVLCLMACAGLLMVWSSAFAAKPKSEPEMQQEAKMEDKSEAKEKDMEATVKEAKAAAKEEPTVEGWAAAFAEASGLKARKSTSGLVSFIVEEGQGASPSTTDTVTVHYLGTLLDGTKFDSSYDRGEPATFPLDRVIKGWTEGVSEMKPGEKRILVIPSDLAYGPRGAGGIIKPNSPLVFEVELLEIK